METVNPFAPAVKSQLKARVAFDGPTGSGKTWTSLKWATVLAGDQGKIALIDTERESARLYAPHFTFDTVSFPPPYEVDKLTALLRTADDLGYSVIVIDSLSHFWEGEGGVLDEVDAAGKRAGGNSYAGWKHGTPLQRNMVDVILGLNAHVIVTMRSKMEYTLEEYTDGRGQKKSRPVKIGMAPVQRGGLEYEFTVVGDMDLDHCITFSKSRCDLLGKTIVQPGREVEAAETFLGWLNDGTPPPPPAEPAEVKQFLAQVKDQGDSVRNAMNAWWKEHGYVADALTLDELTGARGHLADLLIEQAENDGSGEALPPSPARGSEAENSEPSSDVGGPGGIAGEGETGDVDGPVDAAPPIAEEVDVTPTSASSDEKKRK